MTTWILTDEAGKTVGSLGEWVRDTHRKIGNLLQLVDVQNLPDEEVKTIMARHGVEVMMSDDLMSPLKSELRPPLL